MDVNILFKWQDITLLTTSAINTVPYASSGLCNNARSVSDHPILQFRLVRIINTCIDFSTYTYYYFIYNLFH